jgi:hypothetical protein
MTSLPGRIQGELAAWYGVDDAPAVGPFIEATDGGREALLVRDASDHGGALEVRLRLPRAVVDGSRAPTFDELCQAIEGVSHFLCLAERARRELPVTQLELELQAEVDKYVLLTHGGRSPPALAARVRARLFESVHYLHAEHTERGARYRVANDLAARFARRLEASFARHGRLEPIRAALRRFYGAGQTEKIGLAQAA